MKRRTMKMMKTLLVASLCASMVITIPAFAEEAVADEVMPEEPVVEAVLEDDAEAVELEEITEVIEAEDEVIAEEEVVEEEITEIPDEVVDAWEETAEDPADIVIEDQEELSAPEEEEIVEVQEEKSIEAEEEEIVVQSEVSPTFTGFRQVEGTSKWAYYVNGEIAVDVTDIVKGKVDGEKAWWYVEEGYVAKRTLMHPNDRGTWYVKQGKVDQSRSGFVTVKGSSYYLIHGKLDVTVTGLVKGKIKGERAWWYVKEGVVTTDTGLRKNDAGVWYVKDGKIDTTYTGFAKNSKGWWYVKKGKVRQDTTSVIKGTVRGEKAWWYVVNGRVRFADKKVGTNANGIWYINGGKVDNSFTGIVKNKGNYYYMVRGKAYNKGYAKVKVNGGVYYYYFDEKTAQACKGFKEFTKDGATYRFFFNTKNGIAIRNHWMNVPEQNAYYYFGDNGQAYTDGVFKIGDNYHLFAANGKATAGWIEWAGKHCCFSGPLGQLVSTVDNAVWYAASRIANTPSDTNFLITVDTDACIVTIFQGCAGDWSPIHEWQCSPGATGANGQSITVHGTFKVQDRGISFGNGFTCWYWTQFYGNYLFHSVLYNPGSMTSLQDGRLGMRLSHGCVRMDINDAKWIYDNIPRGTTVVVW